jgi:type IX secretion system PorP/SprF family membrane protein
MCFSVFRRTKCYNRKDQKTKTHKHSNPKTRQLILMKKNLTLLLLLAASARLLAQDIHFTQFFAAPMTINPALTGAFEGKYRVASIYRDQWRRVLDFPATTFAVAADLRFDARKKQVKEDAIGLGLLFTNDKTGIIDFNTTQIGLSLAYHKSLNTNNTQFLTLGIQGTLNQRNVNFERLSFFDQFDGQTGFVLPTGEEIPVNNFSYSDYNVGLNYSAEIGRDGRLFAGAALHHFLRPIVSFNETINEGDRLNMKASGHIAAHIPLRKDNRVAFLPRVMVAAQGNHLQVNAGANFRTAMGKYGGSALHLGGWARPVRNSDGFGLDAIVAMAGLEINNVLFGLSYDLNLKALGANQRQGAFELSIAYLGNYDSEDIICPKF